MLPDLQSVPVSRLAALVREQLVYAGVRLADVLGVASGPATDIDPASLPEAELRRVALLLEADGAILLSPRWSAPLRLEGSRLTVAHRQTRLPRRAGVEQIADRYVRLVHDLRGRPAGARLVIRQDEVAALGELTGVPYPMLRNQIRRDVELLRWMSGSRRRRVRSRLGAPTMGLMAGAAALGGLELLRRGWMGNSTAADAGALASPGAAPALVQRSPGGLWQPAPEVGPSSGIPAVGSPAPARGGTVHFGGPHGEIGATALDLIPFDWQTRLPGWTIVFKDRVPERLGYAHFDQRRIEIYVRSSQTPRDVAEVLAHELGHAVDVTSLTREDRARWLGARGLESTAWWPPEGARSDFASGAGDWAEAFAMWLLSDASQSEVGGPLTPEHLALVEELVQQS